MTTYVIDIVVNTQLAQTNVKGLGDQIAGLGTAVKALALGALAKETIELGDAYTTISNKLKSVTDNQYQLNDVMDQTFKLAQETRMSWDATVKGYSRIRQATEQLGLSQKETLTITDSINKLLRVGGATAQESASVMLHLTHAFDEGKLHGRQLNMVMMESIPIQRAIAKELGVTTGELRQMGMDGRITADVLARAFIHANAEATKQYGETVATVADRITQLKNSAEKMIGEFNKGSGVFGQIGNAIGFIANHLDVLATTIMTVAIPAIIALTVAWAASPLGFVTVVAGAAITGALALADATNDMTAAEQALYQATYEASEATKGETLARLDAIQAVEDYRREHNALAETFHMLKLSSFDLTAAWIQNAAALRRVQEAIVTTAAKIQVAKIMAATGGEGYEGAVIRIEKTWNKINHQTDAANRALETRAAWWARVKLAAQEADYAQQKALMAPMKVVSGTQGDVNALAANQGSLSDFLRLRGQRKAEEALAVEKSKKARGIADMQQQIEASRQEYVASTGDTNFDTIFSDTEGTKKAMRDLAQEAQESGKLVEDAWVNAFKAAEDSLTTFIRTGEFNFKKFTDGILDDIARILARQVLLSSISALGGYGIGGGAGGAANTLNGNASGSSVVGTLIGIGGALATSYVTGGGGNAVANQAVSLRSAPTPTASLGKGGGGPVVQVINRLDPKSVLPVLDSAEGIRRINNGQRLTQMPPGTRR